jgi:lipoyl-dependent peroxiredoxin
MALRKADAPWEGGIRDRKDQVDFGNGAFKRVYAFNSRFEDGKGTNPEELLGAAHASCFAIVLGGAGSKPDYVDATPQVTILPQDGGFGSTKSHLVCEAAAPVIDAATFARHSEAAKAGCPGSQALARTTIILDTNLLR